MINYTPELSLLTSSLKKHMYEADEMQRICELCAPQIKTDLNPVYLLKTICKLESSFGRDCNARFEPAYYPGGLYFRKSKMLQEGWDKWGSLVSFSYGPFQIMWVRACELGYPLSASPLDLWNGFVSCPYVVELINDAASKGVRRLEDILAIYNGGMGALKRPLESTKKYVTNGVAIYSKL